MIWETKIYCTHTHRKQSAHKVFVVRSVCCGWRARSRIIITRSKCARTQLVFPWESKTKYNTISYGLIIVVLMNQEEYKYRYKWNEQIYRQMFKAHGYPNGIVYYIFFKAAEIGWMYSFDWDAVHTHRTHTHTDASTYITINTVHVRSAIFSFLCANYNGTYVRCYVNLTRI